MPSPIIRTFNLGKQFRRGHAGPGDSLDRIMDRLFGKRALREQFWALRNVTFDIPRGDSFGLVGPNGSGKSTLLKVLAHIYKPTEGRALVAGRVVPFLELGWGLLEGEQTGSGNIYFAGTLLGLSTEEIHTAFDDIVRFADLEKYLHTPIKYYSTGMQIRLTFAIALFARPEIFLVDEILAVGDISFRRKCYDALKGLHREEQTLLFVSHDLPAMREFCDHGLFLLDGRVRALGDIDEAIEEYMYGSWTRTLTRDAEGDGEVPKKANILDVRIRDARGRERGTFRPWEPVDIVIYFRVNDGMDAVLLSVKASGDDGQDYFSTSTVLSGDRLPPLAHRARAVLAVPHIPILQGKIMFTVGLSNPSMTSVYDRREKIDTLWIVNTTDADGTVDFHPEWRFG